MNVGIESLAANVGFTVGHIFALVIVLGNLIFWAIKFELGNLMLLAVSIGAFIISYTNGGNYTIFLVLSLVSVVFMAFSLLFGQKAEGGVLG